MLPVLRITSVKSIWFKGQGHADQGRLASNDPGHDFAEFIAIKLAIRDNAFHGRSGDTCSQDGSSDLLLNDTPILVEQCTGC